jgi:Leucine-rich repeat (LRR) protein
MTMKGQELDYYSSAFSDMVIIDLSSNHLTGRIPEEIASLYAVVNLNLSRNNLTGKIPERIGVMQSLESLDLSRNNLYGEIPQSVKHNIFKLHGLVAQQSHGKNPIRGTA